MPYFKHDGHRLAYTVYGEGPRTTVLLPGLLFSQRMHVPLARELAQRGNRVVTLDLLGHGKSARPDDMRVYGMEQFAQQTIGLLDHLDIEDAVVGGTSLGANVTLSVASVAPERLRGMIIEMPVLDNALLGCAIAFTPLLVGLTFGAPVARLVGRGARLVPRGSWLLGDMLLDWLAQDPKPSASVLQGLFYGRVAPPREERAKMTQPTLVIGHYRDPIHPFSDSDMLVRELPGARLLEASSILELRLTPERLTSEIVEFIESCFKPAPKSDGRRRTSPRTRRSTSTRRGSD
jgi:pimeloyl-ACP methyl ester carboxylesterase